MGGKVDIGVEKWYYVDTHSDPKLQKRGQNMNVWLYLH